MKAALLLASAGLALAGCQTCPVPSVTTVKVPVTVPCIKDRPARPQYETPLPPDAQDGDVVLALGRDWLLSRKYETELEASIAGCQ